MSKLKSNFKPWDEGHIAILTCDEWIQLEIDENRSVSSAEAFKREDRAVDVVDEAIIRMMSQ